MTHRDRLGEARRHLAHLVDAEQGYLGSSPYRLLHEHDMRAGRYVVRVVVMHPIPAEIVELTGSVTRELRAALDDLASELGRAQTLFPIFESLPLFAQRARKALARMPEGAQAAIESLQPYHEIGGFRNGMLWRLKGLAEEEMPSLAAGAVRAGARLGVNTQRKVQIAEDAEARTGAFEVGGVIANVESKVVGPDPKLDMFLRASFALAFASRGPGGGAEVVELLGRLCDYVEQVVFGALDPIPGS